MKDIEIEKLLNKIHNSDLYSVSENEPKEHKEIVKYRRNLQYFQKELKLIRISFSNKDFFELTSFGNSVIRKGGWIEYQRIESEKEKRSEKKDIFEFKVSKFRYHTFWWFFAFALIASIFSIYNFGKNLSNSKDVKEQEERMLKMEEEVEKLRTSILNRKSIDSLNNTKILNKKKESK